MGTLTLLLFVLVLTGCVLLGQPLLLALGLGYVIFFGYALAQGHGPRAVLEMSWSGIRTVKNILILFLMIGMLTALWRLAGTIPAIVYYAAGAVAPSVMVLMSFLLNCLVSLLTGTAFGTAATMGVICMTMATAMGVDPAVAGGAILSGVFFGDRCSPVSTSALLVAELTETDIFQNLRRMARSAMVPFLVTCGIYALMGLGTTGAEAEVAGIRALFAGQFRLGLVPLLPAVLVLALAAARVKVRLAMLASILAAVLIALVYQGAELAELLRAMVVGYHSVDPALAPMVDGGGLASMVKVGAIVCLSSSYAGIFRGTGLLEELKGKILALSRRTSVFGCILGTSLAACMVACNQTLAVILTHQVCHEMEPDRQRFALALEDTAVVIAPLIPWSIAGATPLATVGAPTASILAACYLYLLPLWALVVDLRRERRARA